MITEWQSQIEKSHARITELAYFAFQYGREAGIKEGKEELAKAIFDDIEKSELDPPSGWSREWYELKAKYLREIKKAGGGKIEN